MEQLRPSQVKWHARQFPDTGAQWHKLEPGSPPASETWSRIRRWRFGKWIKTWIANGFLWSDSRSTWILSIERERKPRREEFTGHSTWVYRTGGEGAAIAKLRTQGFSQSPTAVLQQMQHESLSCSFLDRCVQNCVTAVCPRRSGRDPECGLVLTWVVVCRR